MNMNTVEEILSLQAILLVAVMLVVFLVLKINFLFVLKNKGIKHKKKIGKHQIYIPLEQGIILVESGLWGFGLSFRGILNGH